MSHAQLSIGAHEPVFDPIRMCTVQRRLDRRIDPRVILWKKKFEETLVRRDEASGDLAEDPVYLVRPG
jgi:hypothetical protein